MKKIFTLLLSTLLVSFLSMANNTARTPIKKSVGVSQNLKKENNGNQEKNKWALQHKMFAQSSSSLLRAPMLKSNTVSSFTNVTLPFSGRDMDFSSTNTELLTIDFWGGQQYPCLAYKFTIDQDTSVMINFDQDFATFLSTADILSSESLISQISSGQCPYLSQKLTAGTYYLYIIYPVVDISYSLNISEVPSPLLYTDVDYSSVLTIGESKYGKINKTNALPILTPETRANGTGYNMNVEAGKIYKLTFDVYAPQPTDLTSDIILLTGDDFQGNETDFNGDMLGIERQEKYNTNSQSVSLIYQPTLTGNIRVLLQSYLSNGIEEVTYSIKTEEIQVEPFSFKSITLPYNNESLEFLPGSVYVMGNEEKAKGFTFTLDQDTTVVFNGYSDYYDWGPSLSIFRNESLQDTVYYREWLDGYSANLSAGTYYVLVDDDNFSDASYYSCYLSISIEGSSVIPTIPSISLAELLDAAIEINYANLPFYKPGSFDAENTSLVKGESIFREEGYSYFADAYKIHLNVDDSLLIHHSQSDDAYLYVYRKDISGNYILLYESDDDYNGEFGYNEDLDSYIEFAAEEAGDYYVVATTYDEYDEDGHGNYFLNIWGTGNEPSYIMEINLVSLSSSLTNIVVDENASEIEILIALSNLVIKGETDQELIITIENNPYLWVISEDGKTATFVPSALEGYVLAEGLSLTVTINDNTGVEKTEASNDVTVFGLNKNITITNAIQGANLSIYDIAGRLVINKAMISSSETVSVPKAGIYIVRVGSDMFKIICQ